MIIGIVIKSMVSLWSHIYTLNVNRRLNFYKNRLYSIWISNFVGEVGEASVFRRPIFLQGGGQRRIKIGKNTRIDHHTILGCWQYYDKDNQFEPEIIIGDECIIGEYCHITAINKITIGDGLLTGRYVYIGDNAHGGLSWEEAKIPPVRRKLISKGEIKIGNNVWIGDKVSIFGGVTIGDNVIVGAGSIVTHNVPSNSLVAGAPAKIIKQL